MPDLIRHPVWFWIPACAGMTSLIYFIAGSITFSRVIVAMLIDWTQGRLNDLCSVKKDVCKPVDAGLNVYVGLEHIESGRFFIQTFGKPDQVISLKNRFASNDVLYGKLRPYLDKAVVVEVDGICSTDILVFEPKNKVPPVYIVALLHTDQFIQYAKQTTDGVNHPRTSWASLREFPVEIPPILEQQKIAAVLFKIQQAIEIQEAIIEKTRELKKSTLHHIFTHGLRGERLKETEIGQIPEGWLVQNFGEFATLHRGYDLPIQDRTSGSVPIVGSNGVVGYHNVVKIKGPGVVTGRSGSIGISYYVEDDYWPLNTGLYVEDFHGNDPLYVHYFFQSFNFGQYAAGVSVPTLNRNLVHAVLISVPQIGEQKDIANIFKSIDQRIDLHATKKSALQDLFKTMLNKLMTGEIRVKDLDIDVPEVSP